jgi:transposase
MGQVEKIKERFGIEHVVFVGDRGMIKQSRIPELRKLGGVDWVSALDSKQLQRLVHSDILQLDLFDETNLVEVESTEYPGERIVVCRNPALAAERRRKREELLTATEVSLAKVQAAVTAGRLTDAGKIGERVGRVIGRYKMRKHFLVEIAEGIFSCRRDEESIRREADLDGFYAVRTSLSVEREPSAANVVRTYKRLAKVERVFRSMKTTQLLVRPIYHYDEQRVRAHIFLCMLAAHVLWHLEHRLSDYLFMDPGLEDQHENGDPVVPPVRSEEGERKTQDQTSADDFPLHSVRTLLAEMATLARLTLHIKGSDLPPWDKDTRPSDHQAAIFRAAGNPEV